MTTTPHARTRMKRSSLALALEPRILLDAAAVSTAADVAAKVDATASAPGVEATPTKSTLTITDSTDSFAPVNLFDQVSVSLDQAGQKLTNLVITVNSSGTNQALVIDGQQIVLSNGTSGVTAANGYGYTVSVSGGISTVSLNFLSSAEPIFAEDAQTLLDDMRYQVLDTSVTSGDVSVTLQSLTDQDGQQADLSAIRATITLDVPGESPALGADIGALELAELIKSLDYPTPYAGLNGVISIDNLVYALRSTTDGDVTLSTLYVFQRDQDGALILRDTLVATAQNGLASGSHSLDLSADGSMLYLTRDDGSVALFNRDAVSGELAAQGIISISGGVPNNVVVNGDHAYVSTTDGLLVLQRDTNGWTEQSRFNASGPDAWFTDLQLSADGRFLFAATSGGNTLVNVFAVNSSGALSLIQNVPGTGNEHYANLLSLSADGKTLYLADGSNLFSLAVASDGQLTLDGTPLSLDGTPKQILPTQDGKALLIIGEGQIELYTRAADGSFSLRERINGTGEQDDWGYAISFNELRGATLSADGTQLYLSGIFAWDEGLLVLDLTPQTATFSEDGSAVAILPGGTLADPQLDLLAGGLGNYNGASIVVARDGGALAEDRFAFIASADLKLENGQILLNDQPIATFVAANGALTLTFIASVSQADAQRVLRGIAYANDSHDPAANVNLRMVLSDGDNHRDSLLVAVNLVGVNDAPTVVTSGLSPTFNAEGEAVKLFDGTVIDAREADQVIWQVVVTLEPTDTGDILGVDGGKILLDKATSGTLKTATGLEYSVRLADGKATVYLYLMSSTQRAASVVDSLSYSNSGDNLSGTRTITLSVKDNGGGSNTSTTSQATVTLAPALAGNTAPEIGSGSPVIDYSEQANPVLVAPDATLSDTQMGAFNNGAGNFDGAVLSISLGDGKSTADTLGFTDGNGLRLSGNDLLKGDKAIGTVSIANGVMTIRFSDAAGAIPTTADVQNTLNQITYANSSDVPAQNVDVSITLTDQRGLASTALELTIAITPVNDAPVIGNDPALSMGDLDNLQEIDLSNFGLSAPSSSAVAADGSRVYIADAQGNIALFSRDAGSGALTHVETFAAVSGGIGQLQLSRDGKSLYALRAEGNGILWFSVDAAGKPTHASTLASGEVDGLPYDIKGISLSEDGTSLYLIDNYSIALFSRDTSTGALTHADSLAGSMNSAPYLWQPTEIVSQGDLLFVTTNGNSHPSLIVYQRGSNGELSLLGFTTHGDMLNNLQHLTVSADGKTVFVANSRTSVFDGWTGELIITEHAQAVEAFQLDTSSGALTHIGSFNGTHTVEDIAVSADGAALFVTLSDGSVSRYVVSTGELKGTQAIAGAGRVVVTDSGIIVLGSGATVIDASPVAGPSVESGKDTPALLAPTLTLSDAELNAAGSYQGASISITGSQGDSFGFDNSSTYSLDGSTILHNGQPVATLVQSGNGATLTFTAALSQAEATALLRQITYATRATTADTVTRTVTLVLNDGANSDAKNSNTFTVDVTLLPPNLPPVLNDDHAGYAPALAQAGMAYESRLPAELFQDPEGGALSWSVSGLPNGLSFDPTTLTISGIAPRTVGPLSITVTVSDAAGQTASIDLTLDVVNSAPVADSNYALDRATVGQAYSVTLPDSLFTDANDSSLSWEIVGDLPQWLSYDADTRSFSAAAANQAGSFQITLRALDGQGGVGEITLTLVVVAETPNTPETPETPDSPDTPQADTPATPALDTTGGFRPQVTNWSNATDDEQEDAKRSLVEPNLGTANPASSPIRESSLASGGLSSNQASLREQLVNADRVLTDTGYQSSDMGSFAFDGTTFSAQVDNTATSGPISLNVPQELPGGGTAQRVILANGLPLPSWASFDPRSGELRIDQARIEREGVVRLTLISRDGDGREQRTQVEIRAAETVRENADRQPDQKPTSRPAELSERLSQQTPGALLSEARELLEQLSELVESDLKHIA